MNEDNGNDDKLLSIRQIAQYIGISSITIHKYRKNGKFPQPIVNQPKLIRFRKKDIDDFFKNKR